MDLLKTSEAHKIQEVDTVRYLLTAREHDVLSKHSGDSGGFILI